MQKDVKKKEKSSVWKWVIIVLLLLLLIWLFWMYLSKVSKKSGMNDEVGATDSLELISASERDSSDTAFSLINTAMASDSADSANFADSVKAAKAVQDSLAKVRAALDAKKKASEKADSAKAADTLQTVDTAQSADSTQNGEQGDSLVSGAGSDENNPCSQIKDELWVYPDPSGGLHSTVQSVSLFSNRPCSIWYRFKGDTEWQEYSQAIKIEKTSTLEYRAQDSCGNVMKMRDEFYEFHKQDKSPCQEDMVYIKIDSVQFCIDRFEWPNKQGELPMAYISLYHAMDSCFSAGKRLCTSDEWSLACSGPYGSKYPYGKLYEQYACGTHDTISAVSGSKPECRSYFGVFDMSGNLMEWTSTKAKAGTEFHNIMGGFWESGPQSGCFDKRYSYYPRNRHNPVGFRCCKDLSSLEEKSSKRRRK